jgi:hypothetical protein
MKVKDFFKGLFALCFLIFLIVLGWAMFTSMVKVFGEYTSAIEPTIVVAIVSGLGAIIVNAIAKVSERKNQAFTIAKEKMTAIYESFLTDLDNAPIVEVASVFTKYQSLFAVNASDDTYQEFLTLKDSESKDPSRLIVSMRNELKVSNKKNKKQDTKA